MKDNFRDQGKLPYDKNWVNNISTILSSINDVVLLSSLSSPVLSLVALFLLKLPSALRLDPLQFHYRYFLDVNHQTRLDYPAVLTLLLCVWGFDFVNFVNCAPKVLLCIASFSNKEISTLFAQ